MQDFSEVLNPENSDPEDQGSLTELMYDLIDEMSLGMSFEVHRAAKIGTLFLDETDSDSQKQYELVNERGLDIFGQVPTKKQYECVCPSCGRNMAASRFAPHLEKCMGMGRNSSRIASRRIANATQKKDSGDESDENVSRDDDWSFDRKVKRVKKENKANNNQTKKGKSSKVKNGDSHPGTDNFSIYESMTLEEKKALLMSTCGVISEHTKKMCTKSLRCPQHTEQQRRTVRAHLLRQTSFDTEALSLDDDCQIWSDSECNTQETQLRIPSTSQKKTEISWDQDHYNRILSALDPDEHVDIDTYNEEDSQSLVQTLQWEAVSNPSPADSCSTTGSTSKKRKTGKSTKKKGSKSKNDTPVKTSRSDTPVKNRSDTPVKGSRSDTPSKLSRSDTPSKLSRCDTPSKLSRSDSASKLSRSDTPSKLVRSETPSKLARGDTPSKRSDTPSSQHEYS